MNHPPSPDTASPGEFSLFTTEQKEALRQAMVSTLGQMWMLWLLTLAVYIHTLNVPFYLDDYSSIVENQALYDLSNFNAIYGFSPPRWVGYLTLAVNIHLHGFNLPGYHLFNIIVHLLAGTAIYFLARALLSSPHLTGRMDPWGVRWFPFLTAAIFLLHPLHTQAVTYVVQRLASMVSMFYFATMAFYIMGRVTPRPTRRWIFFFLALISALLALNTKQNSATLPMALILMELIFFPISRKKIAGIFLGGSLAAVALIWLIIQAYGVEHFSLNALDRITRENPVITRQEYFFTQLAAWWEYIRLFLFPVGLHLEHDFPKASGEMTPQVWGLLASHLAVLVAGLALVRKAPVVTFSILFYYLAHQVESGFLPIGDRFFEHRAYLPDLGAALLASFLLLSIPPGFLSREKIRFGLFMLLLTLAMGTWQRNDQWRDPIAFYEDNVGRTSFNSRAMAGLSRTLLERKRFQEGLDIMNDIIAHSPPDMGGTARVSGDIVVNLIWALSELGYDQEAMELAVQALGPNHKLRTEDISKIRLNMGNIHMKHGEKALAEQAFQEAVTTFPANITALANLAMLYMDLQRFREAEPLLARVVAIQSDYGNALELLEILRKVNPTPGAKP